MHTNVNKFRSGLRYCDTMQVAENGDLRFTSSRAQIIDELETSMPNWLRQRNPQWYPKFVHILTVSTGLAVCAKHM